MRTVVRQQRGEVEQRQHIYVSQSNFKSNDYTAVEGEEENVMSLRWWRNTWLSVRSADTHAYDCRVH